MNSDLRREAHAFRSPYLSRFQMDWERPSQLITPTHSSLGIYNLPMDAYIAFIEEMIRKMLPESLLSALTMQRDPDVIKERIDSFNKLLPIVSWNYPESAPCTISAAFLGPADFTSGVGRYLCDTLSRSLVPGKFLTISSAQSLNFKFVDYPDQKFFFQQVFLDVKHELELKVLKTNQNTLAQEIRLNVLAVQHARGIVATNKSKEKHTLIENTSSALASGQTPSIEKTLFEKMEHFLVAASVEQKMAQIKDKFIPVIEQYPHVFDRDIFNEIKHCILLFKDPFTALHDFRHLGRLIAFQYLFRKGLRKRLEIEPQERHILIKLLKTNLAPKKHVVGVLGGVTIVQDNELFEERHLLQAIQKSAFQVTPVEDSLLLDRRTQDPIRTFYVEIEKKDHTPFTLTEMRELKKNLLRELKSTVESVVHPVFMPRNEEEVMRNIVILSQELRYVDDLPQVILSFNTQTEEDLSFTVILLRVLKKNSQALSAILKLSGLLRIEGLEVKNLNVLRKKYTKEANIFSVYIKKKQFLRADYSLDLFRARQEISLELSRLLGGMRDFNGTILSKQQEAFQKLQNTVAKTIPHPDFLLENFFYALSPPLQQSLLPSTTLKALFELLLEALEVSYTTQPFYYKTLCQPGYCLLLAASTKESLKDSLTKELISFPSAGLCSTHVILYGIHCMGYIYQTHNLNEQVLFQDKIQTALKMMG